MQTTQHSDIDSMDLELHLIINLIFLLRTVEHLNAILKIKIN